MKPRITLRVNGARVGDPARPAEPSVEPTRLPMKRVVRVNAALSTRPNEYMPDDGGAGGTPAGKDGEAVS